MKAILHYSRALLAGATLLLTATLAEARDYGVSKSSAGRGTKYTTERGGTAYVGPRGVAAKGAGGNKIAANRYGGATAVTNNGKVYRRGGGAVPATRRVAVSSTAVVVAPLPVGFIRTVPVGYTTVVYGGYTCRYVGGIYYRPVMYQGTTVYIVVR